MTKRILIVDDDKTLLVWMSEALLKKDYEVDVAINGAIALEKIKANKPDLIITDVLMPEMDGFQFFKEVKKNKEMANVLFMVQTGRKMMEDSFAGLGVTDFLSKPCLPDDLYSKVESIIARAPAGTAPEPLPLAAKVAAKPSLKGQVELTEEQKKQLNKSYLKAGIIFGIIMFAISIGVFMQARIFVAGTKNHSVASQLMQPEFDESQINGEVNEYDDEKRLRAVMFYDHGKLKWRKLYNEKGFLTAEEKY